MKQQANEQRPVQSPIPPRGRRDLDPIALVTLIGVIALLMISYSNMRDIDRLDVGLGQRLGKLEGLVAQGARPAAAPTQGVDPATRIESCAPHRGGTIGSGYSRVSGESHTSTRPRNLMAGPPSIGSDL